MRDDHSALKSALSGGPACDFGPLKGPQYTLFLSHPSRMFRRKKGVPRTELIAAFMSAKAFVGASLVEVAGSPCSNTSWDSLTCAPQPYAYSCTAQYSSFRALSLVSRTPRPVARHKCLTKLARSSTEAVLSGKGRHGRAPPVDPCPKVPIQIGLNVDSDRRETHSAELQPASHAAQ